MSDLDLDALEARARAAIGVTPPPLGRLANRMDAPDGPECRCGRPSRYEAGDCAVCRLADALTADVVLALVARVREAEARAPAAEREADRWRLAERIEREHRPTWYAAHADREDEPGRDAGWVCHGCGGEADAAAPEGIRLNPRS